MTSPPALRLTRLDRLGLPLLLALHLGLGAWGLGERWLVGHQGFNGALRSLTARNYLRYGLGELGLAPVKSPGPLRPPEQREVHWHHPPTLALAVAASFALFGESEAAARAVPLAASTAALLLLWWLVRREHAPPLALAAGALFALMPMQIEYGAMCNYEPPVLACLLAATLFHLRYLEARRARDAALAVAACAAGLLFDWPAALFAALLAAHALLAARRGYAAALLATTAALGATLVAWLASFAGDGLAEIARARAGGGVLALAGLTAERCLSYLGLVPVAMAAAWTALALRARERVRWPLLFLAWPLGWAAVFREGAAVHNFWLYGLLPWAAAAPPLLLPHLAARLGPRRARLVGLAAAALFLALLPGAAWRAHLRSYEILPPHSPAAGPPRDGRYDLVLLAQHIREVTRFEDAVAVHRETPRLPLLPYYLDRRVRPMGTPVLPPDCRVLLVPERAVHPGRLRSFIETHGVTRALGYLVIDREAPPGLRELRFEALPTSLAWRYLRSTIYPPGELR